VDVQLSWRAVLPAFAGQTETTVDGAFGAFIELLILEVENGGPRPTSGGFFFGNGPGLAHIAWQESTESWRILSVEGSILEPVPEPATLLLVGTTAAGLGLVRWYRRRDRAHAA
jgi:hypothetical protein